MVTIRVLRDGHYLWARFHSFFLSLSLLFFNAMPSKYDFSLVSKGNRAILVSCFVYGKVRFVLCTFRFRGFIYREPIRIF